MLSLRTFDLCYQSEHDVSPSQSVCDDTPIFTQFPALRHKVPRSVDPAQRTLTSRMVAESLIDPGSGTISQLVCSYDMAACVVESLGHGLADRAQVCGEF